MEIWIVTNDSLESLGFFSSKHHFTAPSHQLKSHHKKCFKIPSHGYEANYCCIPWRKKMVYWNKWMQELLKEMH